MLPAATDATGVTVKLPPTGFMLLAGLGGGVWFPILATLLLLSTLFLLEYLGGGCTVTEVVAADDCTVADGVIFFGDEWKPNLLLFALFGFIVAVGACFFLLAGEDKELPDILFTSPDA